MKTTSASGRAARASAPRPGRVFLAVLALISSLGSTALAGGGTVGSGPIDLDSAVPGEDIASLPIVSTDDAGGLFFFGPATELQELFRASTAEGSFRIQAHGNRMYSVELRGDSFLALERERLAKSSVRFGFRPGRALSEGSARLTLWNGPAASFQAEQFLLPLSTLARDASVRGVGTVLEVQGQSIASYRGVVRFTDERVALAQRVAAGG
jgi:hypothetical protein